MLQGGTWGPDKGQKAPAWPDQDADAEGPLGAGPEMAPRAPRSPARARGHVGREAGYTEGGPGRIRSYTATVGVRFLALGTGVTSTERQNQDAVFCRTGVTPTV